MSALIPSQPDPSGSIIYVGQDAAGHWLVQDNAKRLEGRFISFAAAMSYAQSESAVYHATVELAPDPLSPLVPFTPVDASENVLARAA